jgi:hypothetical protein
MTNKRTGNGKRNRRFLRSACGMTNKRASKQQQKHGAGSLHSHPSQSARRMGHPDIGGWLRGEKVSHPPAFGAFGAPINCITTHLL